MDDENRATVQLKVSSKDVLWKDSLHSVRGLPSDFRPWTCGLSPSALYNCSLKCRKLSGLKTPETKWMSIKRWVTVTHEGISLPPGVFFSVKRFERYEPFPSPHFTKTEFVLMMFPFGNTWSQTSPGVPITEEWLWSEADGLLMFERLLMRDAAKPLPGYFSRVHDYMVKNPDQIGIHLKRKKKDDEV